MNLRIYLLSLVLVASTSSSIDASASELTIKDIEKADPITITNWHAALVEGRRQTVLRHLDVAEDCFLSAVKEAKRVNAAPLDMVTCYRALGESQLNLQLVEDAVPNYKRALSILEKDARENFALLSETLGNLGDIQYSEGEFKTAREYFSRALKVLADAKQGHSYLYASLEHRYGLAAYKMNDPASASDVYYDALQTLVNIPDLPNPDLLNNTLADYIDLYRNVADQGIVRQSAVQKELLKDEPDVISNGKGVAPSAFSTVIAARLADQAISQSRSTTSNSSTLPNSASEIPLQNAQSGIAAGAPIRDASNNTSGATIPNMSGLSHDADNTNSLLKLLPASQISPDHKLSDLALDAQVGQQRIDFYERMVAVDIKALGPNHPSVARDLTSLATVYLSVDNFEEAKPLLQRAVVIYENTYGKSAAVTQRTRTLVHVIGEEQRAREAGESPSNEFLRKVPTLPTAAQTPEVALRLNYLALQSFSYGKMAQALQLYSWALSATARVAGDHSMLTACCLNDYAQVLRACDQIAEAKQFESDAVAIVRANIMKRAASKPL